MSYDTLSLLLGHSNIFYKIDILLYPMDISIIWVILLYFRFRVYLLGTKYFVLDYSTLPTGWFHTILNYIGPNSDEGFKVYFDGTEVATGYVDKWWFSFLWRW